MNTTTPNTNRDARGPEDPNGGRRAVVRRPYSRPRLTCHGSVRGLTMGGSPGIGESGGNNQTYRPSGFYSDDPFGEALP